MHRLWSYGSGNIVSHYRQQIWAACIRIRDEQSPTLRRAYRAELNGYADRLLGEQQILHHILYELERDWEHYSEDPQEYYDHIQSLYLQAFGHMAGVQETEGQVDTSDWDDDSEMPLWHRPEAHSERGRSKLFK